jgi:ABC-type xylose transport system permease subunit
MPIHRRRWFIFLAGLAFIAPLAGFVCALAQGVSTSPFAEPSVGLNLPSAALTLAGMLISAGVLWGVFKQKVEGLEATVNAFSETYMSKALCTANEKNTVSDAKDAALAALTAKTAADVANTAVEAASRLAQENAKQMERNHEDMLTMVQGTRQLTETVQKLLDK